MFAGLCVRVVGCDDAGTMIDDFEQFLLDLGPDAALYTAAELRQLHVEVETIAELLIDLYRSEERARRKQSFPQPEVDANGEGRTIKLETGLTPLNEASASSADPP